ncbi:hypothetical protein AAX26_01809 [Aliarcobacter thereius]|uniref:hypothetical protein n=1 Tax=Aliarcobacter thereius TaxID=544718 RepID=UPI0008275925|nr:hypothetical protein [Aliarcobacter thereius]OCL85742.1 hypothetical protein AAX26_01809 [Aliarcobacter thereius]OCL85800.1 hypothetical protein AAX27_02130 [Aliarcobacter thereius]
MKEFEVEEKIKAVIPTSIKGEIIEVIKREPLNRLEHNASFAIIFKHTKENSLLMVEAVKKLSLNEPKIVFSGSEVDEKFDMENSAVFVTATIK